MKKFIVEKNIPIPPTRKKGKWKEVVSIMEIGDSVLVKNRLQACCLITSARSHHPDMKFTTRKIDEGIRVWRTA